MKKTLAIVLALMMLVLALPVGAAGTGGDNDIPFNDLIGKTDPVVESIAITTLPTKLTYQIGDALDVTGGKVTLTYDDASTEEIDLTAEMVSGFDSTVAGAKTLTVTYGEFTATYDVTIEAPVVLSGIEVTTLPKVTYDGNKEDLDLTGGKITLTYSNGDTVEKDLAEATVTGFSKNTVGKQILTVDYEGKKASYEVMVGFRIAAAALKLESSFTVQWKVESGVFFDGGMTDPYMVFNFNGEDRVVTDFTVESSSRNVYEFTGVASNMMGDAITATLYATFNGKEYASAPITDYSIKKYAMNQLGKSTDSKLKTMLVDMLNYGSIAQLYSNRNTANLVNADLTDAQKALATAETPVMEDRTNTEYEVTPDATVAWKSAALVLDSAVVIRAQLEASDLTGLSVKIKSGNTQWEIPASDFIKREGDAYKNRYYCDFDGMYSNQMSNDVFFTVYKDGVPVSNTLRYTIETYAARNKDKTSPAYLGEMVVAMMKYGNAAKAFAG